MSAALRKVQTALKTGAVRRAGQDQELVEARRQASEAWAAHAGGYFLFEEMSKLVCVCSGSIPTLGRLAKELKNVRLRIAELRQARSTKELEEAAQEIKNLAKDMARIGQDLGYAWRHHIGLTFNPWLRIVPLLKEMEETQELATRIQTVSQQAVSVANPSKGNRTVADVLLVYEKSSNQLEVLQGELRDTGVSESVLGFLQAVSGTDGASLSQVTDEVMEWLGDHTELFRVIAGSSK